MEHVYMNDTIQIRGEVTKSGLPALWEAGGGMSNTGDARIIASPNGSKKTALVVKKRGPLSNEDHALFVVRENDLVIYADHGHGETNINIYKIIDICIENVHEKYKLFSDGEEYIKNYTKMTATCERVAKYSNGEWDNEPTPQIDEACRAAASKCRCYHCRTMFWGKEKPPRY